MIMSCLHTKFHVPSFSDFLVIAIKPKSKHILHAAAMFYILQNITLTKVSKIFSYYGASFQYSKLGPSYCYYWLQK